MEKDLTKGPIFKALLLFALPMMLGNLLQQVYNITDTIWWAIPIGWILADLTGFLYYRKIKKL